MEFDLLDGYLLDGTPAKAAVLKALLAHPAALPAAAPFYEGMRLLGVRTPDLTLIALRLVLAGKRADDAGVVQLREAIEGAKAGDASARDRYRQALV